MSFIAVLVLLGTGLTVNCGKFEFSEAFMGVNLKVKVKKMKL